MKVFLREHWDKGTPCPACAQNVQRYRRALTSGMARVLIAVFQESRARHARGEDEWIHILDLIAAKRINITSGDYAKLRYWYFIEASDEAPQRDTKSNGVWRITPLGCQFVLDDLKVRSHVWIYNNKPLREIAPRTKMIGIRDALGKQFSYSELMNPPTLRSVQGGARRSSL